MKNDQHQNDQDVSARAARTQETDGLPAMVTNMLQDALHVNATDIHVDPIGMDLYRICYRVDGRIHPQKEIPIEKGRQLVNQIKVAAGFTPDHAFAALENRIAFKHKDAPRELRVTIVPTTRREAAHLRFLSPPAEVFRPSELGLSKPNLESIQRTLKHLEGLILITGPTGAGKTMTLYSLASFLDLTSMVAVSVEDPVEFDLGYVRQIGADPEHGFAMAQALKTVLRTDPDIILIGEIRDAESALTAIRAAASGRFVLATMHAADMPLAVEACQYFSVPPHLLGSTLRMVVSQNLLRRVCPACVQKRSLSEQEQALFRNANMAVPTHVPVAAGCPKCHNLGYQGRTGIFQVTQIDREMAAVITQKQSAAVLRQKSTKSKCPSLRQDALAKVTAGVTTIEEVLDLHVPGGS